MKLSTLKFVLGMALVVAAVAVPAYAQRIDIDSPEIGIGGLGSAMALLSGGYLVLTSRLRRKK